MVEDGEIALAIIEGTIVAVPLWLAVLRYSAEDLQLTVESPLFSRWDERWTALVLGGAVSAGFLSLLFAFGAAALVAAGFSGDIEMALLLVGIFITIVIFQIIGAVTSRVMVDTGRIAFLLYIAGIALGAFLLSLMVGAI